MNLHSKLKQAIKNMESLGYRIELIRLEYIQTIENVRRFDSTGKEYYRTNLFTLEEWLNVEKMRKALVKQYKNEVQWWEWKYTQHTNRITI